jgi:hypothetical protein
MTHNETAPYHYEYRRDFDNDEIRARFHFPIWTRERCVSRVGYEDSGGLRVLTRDFHQWCEAAGIPPISTELFNAMLPAHGFPVVGGMVQRLILKADLWALESATR